MNVYLLTHHSDAQGDTWENILGIFSTLQSAQKHIGGDWVEKDSETWTQHEKPWEYYQIDQYELQGPPLTMLDPTPAFSKEHLEAMKVKYGITHTPFSYRDIGALPDDWIAERWFKTPPVIPQKGVEGDVTNIPPITAE